MEKKRVPGLRNPYSLEEYNKPLAPPRPAPKPTSSKKKGRKPQQDNEEESN